MMMVVDISNKKKVFGQVVEELEQLGLEIGVMIKCQKEEIFDSMHRV